MRTFFEKPIREITQICHPGKVTLNEFANIINELSVFQENMEDLDLDQDTMYPEQWMERFSACQIEQEEKPS